MRDIHKLLRGAKVFQIKVWKTYREDLERHPENGWSLYGLLTSRRAQGKTEEANAVAKRFRDAWRLADITLTGRAFDSYRTRHSCRMITAFVGSFDLLYSKYPRQLWIPSKQYS